MNQSRIIRDHKVVAGSHHSIFTTFYFQLGIRDVFTKNAELPLLASADDAKQTTTKNEVQVSKMLQKAGIEINEKGTLAFAATGTSSLCTRGITNILFFRLLQFREGGGGETSAKELVDNILTLSNVVG